MFYNFKLELQLTSEAFAVLTDTNQAPSIAMGN